MKRCKLLPQETAARLERARHSRLLTTAFGALSILGVSSIGCLEDDPLDAGSGGASAGTGAIAAAGTGGAAGSAGSGAAPAAAGNGGASDSEGGSAGNGGSRGEPDTSEEEEANDEGAGETGIFVGMTAAHNAARAALGIDPPLPDLVWSPELAVVAQDWSDTLTGQCGSIEHRMPNMYGENIATVGSKPVAPTFSPEEAVDGWDAEVACWDYGTINGTERCDAACAAGLSSNGCGHYTQLVWRNTRRVGCGYSTCTTADGWAWAIWVCNYDPPGNFIGQTPY
jgi:pathogenesis-related protein 1